MPHLREARVDSQISLSYASARIGFGRDVLARWESGSSDNPIRVIECLARVYGIHPSEFFLPDILPSDFYPSQK